MSSIMILTGALSTNDHDTVASPPTTFFNRAILILKFAHSVGPDGREPDGKNQMISRHEATHPCLYIAVVSDFLDLIVD